MNTALEKDEPSELLVAEDLSVSLSGRPVLKNVSFSLYAGRVTGLIGPNGAGKTTLLRVLLGLVRPSSGRVSLPAGPPGRARRLLGYVPQKIALEPDVPLRARDLVALGLDGHRFGVQLPSAARRATVDAMLTAVNATGFAEARVGQLSGGEQQRVMIAHALMSKPRVLLLDEPLANLDISSSHEVVALLARIARENRMAVMVSAHDMNPLVPVTDRIVYLAGGRAVTGTTDQVVRTETLSELYGHPVEVIRAQGRLLVVSAEHGPDLTAWRPLRPRPAK